MVTQEKNKPITEENGDNKLHKLSIKKLYQNTDKS